MLEKYGDKIKPLYGPDYTSKFVILILVGLNLATAYLLRESSWPLIILLSYVWGGTINHSLTLACHELSHNLVFQNQYLNILFGFIASIPHGLPTFSTFKKYHLIHHRYQGFEGIDTDLPTAMEGRFFTSKILKLLFLLFQPFFYSFRPMILYPGDISMSEAIQYAFQFTFDFVLIKFWGVKALIYLVLGLILGSGLHPLAAHFIAEHYLWVNKKDKKGNPVETYSYYGPLNYLTFFVGYHNEHHDFPQIPGSRLYNLHKIAPEFYTEVKENAHTSWIYCFYRFVMDPTITPFARVLRKEKS